MSFLASNLIVWFLPDFINILITIYFHCQLFFDEDNKCIFIPKFMLYVLTEPQVYF